MASKQKHRARGLRALQMLHQALRVVEQWPAAGAAARGFRDVEGWALAELKQRLEAMEESGSVGLPRQTSPIEMMASLLQASRTVDPDAARLQRYRQTLACLLPDQVAMLALLADRGAAPLCHIAAGRLPVGPISAVVLANATSLGRDAGVLLRECVPQYVAEMLALGVFETGPEDKRLADQYELLLADTQIRKTMDHIRCELRLYPRLQRHSLRLSDYGAALWRDCRPPRDAVDREQTRGSD